MGVLTQSVAYVLSVWYSAMLSIDGITLSTVEDF
jgi:hypothetical protein